MPAGGVARLPGHQGRRARRVEEELPGWKPVDGRHVRRGLVWQDKASAASFALRRLRAKVAARELVSVGVFGGSFAVGYGCEGASRRAAAVVVDPPMRRSYGQQLAMRLADPATVADRSGVGGLGWVNSMGLAADGSLDLVVWDYGCNDMYAMASNATEAGLRRALESSVRYALIRNAAFALLRTCQPAAPRRPTRQQAFDLRHLERRVYAPVAAAYGLPYLSYGGRRHMSAART